jgi:hypothetical protein
VFSQYQSMVDHMNSSTTTQKAMVVALSAAVDIDPREIDWE